MQQPALPAFRVPFFRALAAKPGLSFKLTYATEDVPNVPADGFDAEIRTVSRLPGGLSWDGAYLDLLTPGRWDVQVMTWNTRHLSLVPAIRRSRKLGNGVVVWGHGYSKNEGALRKWLRFKTGQMADAVVFYSRVVAEDYISRGMPREKVFVALNSLDPGPMQAARDAILADAEGLAAFKREHGITGPAIIYVSRLEAANRVPMLIEATKKLLPEFPDLKTIVIGRGEDLDNVLATADRLGIRDRVIAPGPVYGEPNIGPYFCAADVFCYPANIGLSILHAMNYALPVVTSDHIESQNPEIESLRDGANGMLYQHGSVDALAATLATLLRDHELRKRLGAEAHRTATQEYSTDRMADGMEAAIRFANERARARRM